MQNNIGLFLTKRCLLNPDREAFVDGNSSLRLSYSQLNSRCNQLANAFLAAGVKKQERVGILLMNGAEYLETFFALAKIGAVVVPLNWRLVADELTFILKDSGTQRLIFGEQFADTVSQIQQRGEATDIQHWLQLVEQQPCREFAQDYTAFRGSGSIAEPVLGAADEDMLFIMYTSGTTGLPKGVVHTHKTVLWALLTISATTHFAEAERYLAPLPMFHVGALTPIIGNVYSGATSVIMRSFDPARAWLLIEKEKVSCGLLVPAMLNAMLQVPEFNRYDWSSLNWLMSGAAPVPVTLMQAYADLGIEVQQIYGLTETCGPACLISSEHALAKIGSTGKTFFHTEVRVVDDQGQDCQPDVAGEVWVKGQHIMREYWNRPEATAQSMVGDWFRTGDVATMDTEGFVYIQDRIKDMIISGGENIYPAEIENCLQGHSQIVEAAVIGMSSEKWGESPLAIIVATDVGLTQQQVLQYCQGKLARFKQPARVEFVDEIPRNPSGKILKRILREQFPETASV